MFSISKKTLKRAWPRCSLKRRSTLSAKKPSYSKKEALQPMKRKAELTSDRDGAQRDKETERGPQRKVKNGPRKGVEASEIAWVHLSPSGDDSISLSGLVMESSTTSLGHAAQEPVKLRQNSPQSLSGQFVELFSSESPQRPRSLSGLLMKCSTS